MNKVCLTCKYLEEVPFSDELFCGNENSDYADCPTNYPSKDTCPEWEEREE